MSLLHGDILLAAKKRVPENDLIQALQSFQNHKTELITLLQQGKLPSKGWSDAHIEQLLNELAMLDSNNFPHNIGVGEREARIYSGLVSRRHHHLGHGIGRSGDLCASQPKAAGSSLLYQLTASLALDAVRAAGLHSASSACVLPCATGMALLLSLAALAERRPCTDTVIWSRCDQRSCLKAMHTAGLRVVVLEGVLDGDEVVTNMAALQQLLSEPTVGAVRAVVTTTSCFAPRACDEVEQVALLCRARGVPHLVNNAYGLQSTKLVHRVKEAARLGRVDGVIQSTDKNFMVPVGGSLLVDFDGSFTSAVASTYPGRGSASAVVDLLITLLSLGRHGYPALCTTRNALKKHLDEQLSKLALKHGCKLLHTPHNPISAAMGLPSSVGGTSATALGSMLFTRGVSGARLVAPGKKAQVGLTNLTGWGSHHPDYPVAYLTAAACVGMTQHEIDTFIVRLDKCLVDWKKKHQLTASAPDSTVGSVSSPNGSASTVASGDTHGEQVPSHGIELEQCSAALSTTLLTDVNS